MKGETAKRELVWYGKLQSKQDQCEESVGFMFLKSRYHNERTGSNYTPSQTFACVSI